MPVAARRGLRRPGRWRSGSQLPALFAIIAAACTNSSAGPAQRAVLDSSIAFFDARLGRQPDDLVAPGGLADRYLKRFAIEHDIGDVWRAESALVRGLDAHPDYPAFLSRMVAVHVARHEFPEALRAAQTAYRLAPRQALNGPLFDTYFETGQYDSALAALNRMNPDAFGYLIRKARFATARGRPDLAELALKRACRGEGLTDDVLRAWCAARFADLATTSDPKRVIAVMRAALARRPDDRVLLFDLARAEMAEGHLEQAARLFSRVADAPGGAEAHLWLARLLESAGDTAAGRAHRRRFETVATDPRFGRGYWAHLAQDYAEQGRIEEALALVRKDVAQRPGPESYHALAVVWYRAGRRADALAAVDRALGWTPRDPRLLALRDSVVSAE